MRKPLLIVLMALGMGQLVYAQDGGYRTPPKALADLVNTPPTPGFNVDSKGDWVLITERAANPSIAELSQPELRIAGLRINPANNGPSRGFPLINLKLRKLNGKEEMQVKGLPAKAAISNLTWSPDETKIAFTNSSENKIELYVIDVATATAQKLSDLAVNAALGSPLNWVSDSKSLIVTTIPNTRGAAPALSRVPSGPTIQENLGKKGQAPTYQDLLKNPSDEKLFEYHATAQVVKLGLDGSVQNIGQPLLVTDATPSPDGQYVLVESVHRPFSYIVPMRYFPTKVDVYSLNGSLVKTLTDNPLVENAPWGSDATIPYPRNYNWRADVPATVTWVEPKDGGDAKRKVAVRDVLKTLDAPFSGEAKDLYASALRFGGVTWGNANTALVQERWWATRKQVTKILNPSNPTNPVVLLERSFEDKYSDPGRPETRKNQYGRQVLDINAKNELYFTNTVGASPEGDRPFVSVLNLATKENKVIWRSEAPFFEIPVSLLSAEKGLLLTRREAVDQNPNYFIRNLNFNAKKKKKNETAVTQVSFFPDPYPQLKGIQKQVLRYKRNDGVDLTATLYLPAGYKKEDGPLPTFLWAYPAEFKSKDAAGQVSGSPYKFNAISFWGAAAFVTMGYAVLDNASIPIIGEGDKEPNDTYVEQLVASAKAAIDEGVKLGVVDSSRVGVGGHSYGAFMTANLLTHSKLFKAGIARSGAYNRTLTPFGFQNEQRTYWQAPDVSNRMSPFMNADKMKTPLLLIHGEADNNTGTFPVQSERYYNALKGMGATAKLVFLPYESHHYDSQESLMHMLSEMNGWLDKYVKNAGKATPTAGSVGGKTEK
ncbi:S9 family peptidase [Siphonobacter sp.]|uniref:S9 family peptidase n=1 Tax=Siphonobacter sp. TaxID=1869184 RepID=UPI003B3A9699